MSVGRKDGRPRHMLTHERPVDAQRADEALALDLEMEDGRDLAPLLARDVRDLEERVRVLREALERVTALYEENTEPCGVERPEWLRLALASSGPDAGRGGSNG